MANRCARVEWVRYVGLYPGIDLEIAGESSRLVPRLVAHPGADLNVVHLRIEGADGIAFSGSDEGRGGGLRLSTAVGEFTLPFLSVVAPDGTPLDLAGVQPTLTGNEIRAPFARSHLHPLFPSSHTQQDNPRDLLYSTFLGGSGDDGGIAIAVDGAGRAYVTGETYSSNFLSHHARGLR